MLIQVNTFEMVSILAINLTVMDIDEVKKRVWGE
jgi:hypothetical protein